MSAVFAYPFVAYGFLVWVLGESPAHRLGSAVGWFYFAFTGGLPTLGSLVASGTEPLIGQYLTFWVPLVLVVAGGVTALVGLRNAHGGGGQAAGHVTTGRSLINSVAIAFTNPRVGLGCLVRVVNTAPRFGLFVFFLPQHFTQHWVSALCAALFGITLAAFTPISVLMSLITPGGRGNAIAVLNLGADAATLVGPLLVAIFLAPLGAAGVTIIFAGLYVLVGISVHWLRVPEEAQRIIAEHRTLDELTESAVHRV